MNRDRARKKIENLLRRTALRGSGREIRFDQPVGAGGLGLDSLALVAFVLAFEKELKVQVPETVWSRLNEVTPEWFVGLAVSDRAGRPASP